MDIRETITKQSAVALHLTRHLLASPDGRSSNVVVSPPSINFLLSLIAAGSNGPTLDELLSFLNADSCEVLNSFASELVAVVFADASSTGGPRLSFSNGGWVDKSLPLKHSFRQVVEACYKASLFHADFQCKAAEVTREVNSWAEKETNGLIKDVLPQGSVNDSTRLIFANGLYFKGAWNEQFDASKTKDEDFHLLDGTSVKALFMISKKKQFVSAHDGFKVLGLPYKQGEDRRRFSMYFLLPDSKDGLPGLVDRLSSEPGFLDRHLPYERVEVGKFRIPKFKISFGFKASDKLKELGIVKPFSCVGGLAEMVDSPDGQKLYVSSIFHKSFIEVNEGGTEAAAVSVGGLKRKCLRVSKKIDFVADHPFVFLIREDVVGVVLFTGHLVNPLAA